MFLSVIGLILFIIAFFCFLAGSAESITAGIFIGIVGLGFMAGGESPAEDNTVAEEVIINQEELKEELESIEGVERVEFENLYARYYYIDLNDKMGIIQNQYGCYHTDYAMVCETELSKFQVKEFGLTTPTE